MRQRSSAVLVTAAVLLLLQLVSGVSCTGPVVEPEYQAILHHGTATIGCRFDAPLSDCRVRVRGVVVWLSFDTELDLGRGGASPPVTVTDTLGYTWMTAKYAGAGLASGHCGVELERLRAGPYLVQCRGQRNETGDWSQAFGVVASSPIEVQRSSIPSPRYVVASPGSDVSVLLTAQEAMEDCIIDTPAAGHLRLVPGDSPPTGSRYRLHGAGPGNSECGYTVHNVTAADAGLWVWYGWKSSKMARQLVVVAVAAPPVGVPTLRLDDASQLRAGGTVNATCETSPNVPPAQITWLLGDRVVRADAWNSTLDADAAKTTLPWESQPTRQTLSVVLTSSDLGKQLECRVSHVGLSDPWTSSVKIAHTAGFYIQNIATRLVLTVQGNETRSPAFMAEYNAGDRRQLWTYKESMLFSTLNGLVLDVDEDNFLMTYWEHGGPNQRWYFDGRVIRNGNGEYMDVYNGSSAIVNTHAKVQGAKVRTNPRVNDLAGQQFVTVSPRVQ